MTHLSVSFCRFDFDFSLEESIQRRLDLSVKNSVSFMSRERELIGKVYIITHSLVIAKRITPRSYDQTQEIQKCEIVYFFLVALSCSWTWTKLTSRLVSHNGNNLKSNYTILCNTRVECSNINFVMIVENNKLFPFCFPRYDLVAETN